MSVSASTHDRALGWKMLSPAFFLLAVIGVYPYLVVIYHSFHDWSLIHTVGPAHFIGFRNFVKAFADQLFIMSVLRTFLFVGIVLPSEFMLGMTIALLLNHHSLRFKGVFRSLILLPMMLSPIVTAVVWKMIYSVQFGPLNYGLKVLGITDGRTEWIGSLTLALPALAFATIWMWFPFSVLVLLAGLQGIPEEEHEAARIDGASFMQGFFAVTLPHLLPSIMVIILIRFIDALKTFALVYSLTAGGPGTATELVFFNIYKVAFRNFDIGFACSLSIVLVLFTLIFSVILLRAIRSSSSYEL